MAASNEEIRKQIEFLEGRVSDLQRQIAELRRQLPREEKALTVARCRDAKHSGGKGPDRLDGGRSSHGLALVIKPSGAKSWTQRLTLPDGRRTDIGLGPYPGVSLADAKHAAFQNHTIRSVRLGRAPVGATRESGARGARAGSAGNREETPRTREAPARAPERLRPERQPSLHGPGAPRVRERGEGRPAGARR